MRNIWLVFVMAVIFIFSCSGEKKNGLKLEDGKKEIQLVQRHSAEVEGYNRNLYLHIDDITGGSTFLTVKDGNNFLVEENISEGQMLDFEFDGCKYVIECTSQNNVLIGEDDATFLIREPTEEERNRTGYTEEEKIELLLEKVAASYVTFIRNGNEYPPAEAADHLRMKWNNARDKVKTLDDFIEHIASSSSSSGEPYQIKLPDGSTVSANTWMKEQAKGLK